MHKLKNGKRQKWNLPERSQTHLFFRFGSRGVIRRLHLLHIIHMIVLHIVVICQSSHWFHICFTPVTSYPLVRFSSHHFVGFHLCLWYRAHRVNHIIFPRKAISEILPRLGGSAWVGRGRDSGRPQMHRVAFVDGLQSKQNVAPFFDAWEVPFTITSYAGQESVNKITRSLQKVSFHVFKPTIAAYNSTRPMTWVLPPACHAFIKDSGTTRPKQNMIPSLRTKTPPIVASGLPSLS